MDNSLNLASWTEDFLKLSICHVLWTKLALELYLHTWESSSEIRTKFGTILNKWPEFWLLNNWCEILFGPQIQGKLSYNIQAWADIGNFLGATWNVELGVNKSLVPNWVNLLDKWPKFSGWHSFWGPYFCSQSQSGVQPSCLIPRLF